VCGITGFAQTQPALGVDTLRSMTDMLARRGPDDAGHYADAQVGLGMRRLSIIDLEGGQQPIRSHSGRYLAVFNGEIYNYRELRGELVAKGIAFRSHGDGEVLVNLYEEEGIAAFDRLRGMFGVALWDTVERELLLVRDPLGIKPVFYAARGETLLFGSEMKAILAALPGRLVVDVQALDAVLAYTYIPAPLTIWKEVRKLRSGHYLRWRDGRWSEHRYWDLLNAADQPPPTVEEIRAALDDTVRAHLVSDVEVGAFLSGGLDSSTLVARAQHAMGAKIRAFSVRFDTRSHLFDETGYARQLQQACGFELHVETLPPSGYAAITDAMRAFDEPFADDSLMPSDAISAMAAQHLKVVLSGAGGDEFFGGYNRYQGVVLHQRLAALPGWLRGGVVAPGLGLLTSILGPGSRSGDLARRFGRDLHCTADEAYMGYITAAPPEIRAQLLASEVVAKVDPEATRALVAEHQGRGAALDPLKRAMYVDVNTYLPEDVLALSDRVGMWHSLEIRTPLADKVLAEFAFRLPAERLVTTRQKKVGLRAAVADWLPPDILSHPKQGFEGPTASWLRGGGGPVARAAFKSHLDSDTPLLRYEPLERLLDEHGTGKADHTKRLFTALVIAEWARQNGEKIGGVA